MTYSVYDFLNSEKFTITVNSKVYRFEHSYHVNDMLHTLKFTGGELGRDMFLVKDNSRILSFFSDLVCERKTKIEELELSDYNVRINSYLKDYKKVVNF